MFKLRKRAPRPRYYASGEEQLLMALALIAFLFFILVGVLFLGAWVQGGL